jgi:hypothetical protein
MDEKITIPSEESALISTVLFGDRQTGESHAALGIDPHCVGAAPIGKRFRINVDALDDHPIGLVSLLRFPREFDKLFPGRGEPVGVLRREAA